VFTTKLVPVFVAVTDQARNMAEIGLYAKFSDSCCLIVTLKRSSNIVQCST